MSCVQRKKLKPNKDNRLQRKTDRQFEIVDVKDVSKRYFKAVDDGFIPSKRIILVGQAEISDMTRAFKQMRFMEIENAAPANGADKNYFLLEKYLRSYYCKKQKAQKNCDESQDVNTENVKSIFGGKVEAQQKPRRRISVKKLRAEAEKRRTVRGDSVEIKNQAPVSRKRTREEIEEEFQSLSPKMQKLLLRRRMEMLRARIMAEEQK